MMRYLVHSRDRLFIKGYGLFFKINISKNFLIMLNNLEQMHLKLLQKVQFKKQQKQLVIWLVTKLLIELRKSQKLYHKIIQIKLQINMKNKYLKKDMYLQEKDTKLMMN